MVGILRSGYQGPGRRCILWEKVDAVCPDHRSSILAKALLAASRPIRMYSDMIWMAMSGVTAVER